MNVVRGSGNGLPGKRIPGSRRALWVSPGFHGRGGISTLVYDMQETRFWKEWNVRHVGTHSDTNPVARIARFSIALVQVCYELVFHRPEIVHIHVASHGSFLRKCVISWICFALKVPVVLQVHGGNFDVYYEAAPKSIKELIRRTFERADAVIGLGETWVMRIQRMAPLAHVANINNAVRPNKPVEQPVSGTVNCLFLGEVGKRKGTFVLLDAWAKMLSSSPIAATLTIAGNGETARAQAVSAELGIESTVRILSWLSTAEVEQLIMKSHVLVLPSTNEGTPRAILEGMANGLCIVASDVGGIPELVGDTGVLVKPSDPEGLSEVLRHVISDPSLRSTLGARTFTRVKNNFDLNSVADQFGSLYRNVLGG